MAMAETDRFGNIVNKKNISLSIYGKTKNRSLAIIGNATKEIIEIAKTSKKPIVIENLDFQKKKQDLREKKNKIASCYTYFCYSKRR